MGVVRETRHVKNTWVILILVTLEKDAMYAKLWLRTKKNEKIDIELTTGSVLPVRMCDVMPDSERFDTGCEIKPLSSSLPVNEESS